jgi:hypothetical protein
MSDVCKVMLALFLLSRCRAVAKVQTISPTIRKWESEERLDPTCWSQKSISIAKVYRTTGGGRIYVCWTWPSVILSWSACSIVASGHSAKNSLVGSIGTYQGYELRKIRPISMAYKLYQLFQKVFIILQLSAYVDWLVGCGGWSASLCHIALQILW